MDRRREPAADAATAVGLIVLDAIVTLFTLLTVMTEAGYDVFTSAEDNHVDNAVPVITLVVLGALAALSAWPLRRARFAVSGSVQLLCAGALWCWALYGATRGGA
ncbi:hypothetical protein [Streptomyces luteireticuli]|uniref:hypothetical protein n=1 Tax=Streptomyces luteireticuli TaxID=173858 RepID=UPI0035583C22